MDSSEQSRYQVWLVRTIVSLSAVFMVWFVFANRAGLWKFITFLMDSVSVLPQSIASLADYYRSTPSEHILPSVVMGIVAGSLLTGAVYLKKGNKSEVLDRLFLAVLVGLAFIVGLLLLGLNPGLSMALGVLAIIVSIRLVGQKEAQQAINIITKSRAHFILFTIGGGVLGGVIGSQMLIYPTRHCTYDAAAPASEYRIGILLTLLGVIIVLLPLWSVLGQQTRVRDQSSAGYFKGNGVPALFLFPTMLILVVFLYLPTVEIITRSLTQSHARLPGREVFVCVQNYTQLASDASYRNSFVTTFMITAAIVLVSLVASLGIALLASQKVRGAYVYRTLLIWPYALSPVVAGAIFFVMFQQDSGMINYVLDLVFERQLRWFSNATLARIMIIVASVWNILGFNILFYIAGLQTIPADLLESASIDGANRFWRFMHITFPLLAPFTFFLLVTNVTYSFYGIYGVVDVLTQGGPRLGVGGANGATEVLIYRLYEGSAQAGSSAAQALVLFVMIAAITVFQFGYVERRVTYAQ